MLIKCTNFDKHAWEGLFLNLAFKARMDTHESCARGLQTGQCIIYNQYRHIK